MKAVNEAVSKDPLRIVQWSMPFSLIAGKTEYLGERQVEFANDTGIIKPFSLGKDLLSTRLKTLQSPCLLPQERAPIARTLIHKDELFHFI